MRYSGGDTFYTNVKLLAIKGMGLVSLDISQ
jgi:hypothetical protein